jgi:hypothetical protein
MHGFFPSSRSHAERGYRARALQASRSHALRGNAHGGRMGEVEMKNGVFPSFLCSARECNLELRGKTNDVLSCKPFENSFGFWTLFFLDNL